MANVRPRQTALEIAVEGWGCLGVLLICLVLVSPPICSCDPEIMLSWVANSSNYLRDGRTTNLEHMAFAFDALGFSVLKQYDLLESYFCLSSFRNITCSKYGKCNYKTWSMQICRLIASMNVSQGNSKKYLNNVLLLNRTVPLYTSGSECRLWVLV